MSDQASPNLTPAPSLARISDYVAWHAERTPDAEAMVLGDTRISYERFHRDVDELAKALLKAGVSKGDRVATLSPPSPDYFVAFLATASIGAIWVGLNPRYRLDELSFVTNNCEPVVLLARARVDVRDYRSELKELVACTPSLRTLVLFDADGSKALDNALSYQDFIAAGALISDHALNQARQQCGSRDACMIVYTSGSTGKPKGAVLHHEGVIEFSLGQNRIWPVMPLRTLNFLPINHVGCVIDISTPTLVAGGTLVFLEQFSPRRSMELVESEDITLWGSVPSVFQLQFAEKDFDRFDLSAVQLIVWGGAAMPRETIVRLLAFGRPLATNYGLTETSSAVTVIPPTDDVEVLEKTVGWPFETTQVRLVDAEDREVSDGESGELLSRSIYNMLGYWRQPEATAATLSSDGWLRTGDIGRKNPDGSYSIVGRAKEMYKSGGYNVYPREVENVIESHPKVDMAAVVCAKDPIWQEVGVSYVLVNSPVSVEELEQHCRARLANYKLPKLFVLVDELPLLPIGKVDKVALKKRAAKDFQPEGAPS